VSTHSLIVLRQERKPMKKSEITKEALKTSATTLFSKYGYANTSTKDIASLAGVSEATLFKYYKTKNGLFKAMLLSLVSEMKQMSLLDIIPMLSQFYKDKSLYNKLSKLVINRLEFLEKHDATIKALLQETLINDDMKSKITNEVWPSIHKHLSKLFSQAIKDNEIIEVEVDSLITTFLSIITGPIIASYVSNQIDFETRNELIKHHFELFYRNISVNH